MTAPPLPLSALDGSSTTLESQRGRVVLVHFFATWCEPCRDEMASLDRLNVRLKDRRFTILAVDVGEPEVRVSRFFAKQPVGFPILLDEARSAMKAWRVNAFPTTFLVDASGTVRLAAATPVDWDDPAADRILSLLLVGEALPADTTLPTLKEKPPGETQ